MKRQAPSIKALAGLAEVFLSYSFCQGDSQTLIGIVPKNLKIDFFAETPVCLPLIFFIEDTRSAMTRNYIHRAFW